MKTVVIIAVWVPCGNCSGSGFVEFLPGILITCPECHGAKGKDQ